MPLGVPCIRAASLGASPKNDIVRSWPNNNQSHHNGKHDTPHHTANRCRARVPLLFIAFRIDQADEYSDRRDDAHPPPRDPEKKIPRVPPKTTIQPSVLSNRVFLCIAKKRAIGITIISNSPKKAE